MSTKLASDPLCEAKFIVTKGLIHKHANRVLLLVTLNCASHCLFCTRCRLTATQVAYQLNDQDINKIFIYIKNHPKITEIILSGGDPLTAPETLTKIIHKINITPQIKILRLGTRLPIVNPKQINLNILKILKKVERIPLYLMLHVEHPQELTSDVKTILKKLKQFTTMILSQSVFLRGINDNYEILYNLFTQLTEVGVKPYYLFSCDRVAGLERFFVPHHHEKKIYQKLRQNLSGLACPSYVIDSPTGKKLANLISIESQQNY